MSNIVPMVMAISQIRHHFLRDDLEAALAYQFDTASALAVSQAIFVDQAGGLVFEKDSSPAFVGLLLAALALQSPVQEANVERFLKDVASDARIVQEYTEARRRLDANNGRRF
jgi:hypothetical protein